MTFFQSAILGIVQGFTEFLPISSSAHLRIVPALFGWGDPGTAFTAIIQLGTLAAILVYFWKDITSVIPAMFRSISEKKTDQQSKLGWGIAAGTIPIVVFGLALKDVVDGPFRSLVLIGSTLIIFSILLWIAEVVASKKRNVDTVRVSDGFWAGLAQSFALMPGVSRSGSTITGGLLLGFNRESAARISFLLSIPSVLLSGLYELFKIRHDLGTAGGAFSLIVATACAFFVGYWSIGFLLKYLKSHSSGIFIGYRIALGTLILLLVAAGRL